MATIFPDVIFIKSPQTQRVAEFRLLDTIASGAYDGINEGEVRQLEGAIELADPRYGDDPEAACELLKEQGWIVYGTLKRRYLTTKQAGDVLGVSDSRIRQLVMEGRLATQKGEHERNRIAASAVWRFGQQQRPNGRPRKVSS